MPAVVDLVDVDSQKWLDYAAVEPRPLAWLHGAEGRRLRRLEGSLPSWARAVTLVSEAEADLYRGFSAAGRGPRRHQRRRPGLLPAAAAAADEPACVFVGALDYRPNVDAACWFCAEVWPEVAGGGRRPELWLVGRRPTPAGPPPGRGPPGVEVVGQVPDVRPYVAGRRRGRRPAADRPRRAEQGAGGAGDGQGRRRLAAGPGRA